MKFIGKIGFDHYQIDCIIGVHEEERKKNQTIYLDLRVEYDFSDAASGDDFKKTICYQMLGDLCKELSLKGYRLLETFAYDLIQTLMNQYKIKWAFVRIKKPGALPLANYAVVELEGGVFK